MKKILLGIAAIGAYYAFFHKSDDVANTVTTPTVPKTGFNSDGTPRALTPSEITSYLSNNSDLTSWYNANSESAGASLEVWANSHWMNYGFKENRLI